MVFLPKFLYEDGATDKGAGGAAPQPNTTVNVLEPVITADKIKELGFDSQEQALEYLASKKDSNLSEEQKIQKENQEKANFIKYAADEKLISPDDVVKYESLKAKSDRDLVFDSYLKQWKQENPDIKEDAEKIAREDFDKEYNLNSENEKTKARGEAKLKRDAQELKAPFESKYQSAQSRYKEDNEIRAKIPAYNKFMDGLVEKLTPETLTLYKGKEGDDDISIDVKITPEERTGILKEFKENNKTFAAYLKGANNKEQLEAAITKKINSFLKVKYFDAVVSDSIKVGKGIGVKAGSNTGAANPFPLVQSKTTPEGGGKTTLEQSNEKIAAARARFRN